MFCSPRRTSLVASLDAPETLVYVSLIVVVLSAIPFDSFTGTPNKESKEVTFPSLCCLLCLWCELSPFLCQPVSSTQVTEKVSSLMFSLLSCSTCGS